MRRRRASGRANRWSFIFSPFNGFFRGRGGQTDEAAGHAAVGTLNQRYPPYAPYLMGLATVFLAALLLRTLEVVTRHVLLGDEVVYMRMAENINTGLGPLDLSGLSSTVFFPLFSLFVAGISAVLGSTIISGFIVSVVFGALLVVPVYALADEIGGRKLAIRAAILTAVLPLLVDYSSKLYTESVYAFFLVMASVFFWRMLRSGGWLNALLIGVSLGLAYLSNPAAVFYVMLFFGISVVVSFVRRSRHAAGLMALSVALFMLFASPYIVFLHEELGQWTYSGKNATANIEAAMKDERLFTPEWEKDAYALTPDNSEIKVIAESRTHEDPTSFIVGHPGMAEQMFIRDVRIFATEELGTVITFWLVPFLLIGLITLLFGGRVGLYKTLFLLSLLAPLLMIFALGDFRDRFFVPYLPIAIVFIAIGWRRIETAVQARLAGRLSVIKAAYPRILVSLLIGFIVLAPVLKTTFKHIRASRNSDYYTEYKEAGEWLKANKGPNLRVMGRVYVSAYYASGTAVLLPYDSYENTNEYADLNDVDVLVVSPESIPSWRPDLARLLKDADRHPEWRLIHTVDSGSPKELRIYQFQA